MYGHDPTRAATRSFAVLAHRHSNTVAHIYTLKTLETGPRKTNPTYSLRGTQDTFSPSQIQMVTWTDLKKNHTSHLWLFLVTFTQPTIFALKHIVQYTAKMPIQSRMLRCVRILWNKVNCSLSHHFVSCSEVVTNLLHTSHSAHHHCTWIVPAS